MGKVRKLRQKYHLSLKKGKSTSNLTETKLSEDTLPKSNFLMKSSENIFDGVDISWEDITKSLPKDFDVRSVVSNKSRREVKEEERFLKKKEKQKLRHERFMQKLEIAQQIMKKSKGKKKKKVLGGDMNSLLDALPSLQSLEESRNNAKLEKANKKPKGILKAKERLKQQSIDAKIFKQILDDKKFKENPLQAVSQYLKQKVNMET